METTQILRSFRVTGYPREITVGNNLVNTSFIQRPAIQTWIVLSQISYAIKKRLAFFPRNPYSPPSRTSIVQVILALACHKLNDSRMIIFHLIQHFRIGRKNHIVHISCYRSTHLFLGWLVPGITGMRKISQSFESHLFGRCWSWSVRIIITTSTKT